MPGFELAELREHAQNERHEEKRGVGEQHDPAALEAVRNRSGEQAKDDRRHGPEKAVEAQLERGAGNFVEGPHHRGILYPSAKL